MKCCICGKEINNEGNNPWPICLEEDHTARCCDDCNTKYVINARLIMSRGSKDKIQENDFVIIFYSKDSTKSIETLLDTGKFIAGVAIDNEALPEGCWEGTWGNFLLNEKTDSYVVVND